MPTSSVPVPSPAIPARIDPDHETTRRSSAEIKALLDARQSDAQFRIQALKNELTNPSSVTVGGVPLLDLLRSHALRSGGVAAAAGLAVGVLTGVLARRRPEPLSDIDLARERLSSFLDDAADRVRRGASPSEAVRRALRDTSVVLAPPSTGSVAASQATSSVRQAVDFAVKSAVGFALKAATDQLTQKLTGKKDTLTAVAEAPERA